MATIQTTDGQLYYEDEGSGPAVVLLHGMWLSSRFFAKQKAPVAAAHRFIAPDLRSHGRSHTVLHGNTVPLQTRDLHELFEALDLRDIVLVGWSSGAFCAWEYLTTYGADRIPGLVVVDESASDFNWPDWTLGAQDLPGLVGLLGTVQTDFETMVRERFVPHLFATPPSAEDLDWMVEEVLRVPPSIAAAIAFDEITRDYRSVLPGIQVPTLVCFGRQDPFLSPDNGAYLADAIPDARLVMFEQSGHAPFWDEADRFNAVLEEFALSCRNLPRPVAAG